MINPPHPLRFGYRREPTGQNILRSAIRRLSLNDPTKDQGASILIGKAGSPDPYGSWNGGETYVIVISVVIIGCSPGVILQDRDMYVTKRISGMTFEYLMHREAHSDLITIVHKQARSV